MIIKPKSNVWTPISRFRKVNSNPSPKNILVDPGWTAFLSPSVPFFEGKLVFQKQNTQIMMFERHKALKKVLKRQTYWRGIWEGAVDKWQKINKHSRFGDLRFGRWLLIPAPQVKHTGVGKAGSWPPLSRQLKLPSTEHYNFSSRWGAALAETADVRGFTLMSILLKTYQPWSLNRRKRKFT